MSKFPENSVTLKPHQFNMFIWSLYNFGEKEPDSFTQHIRDDILKYAKRSGTLIAFNYADASHIITEALAKCMDAIKTIEHERIPNFCVNIK